MSVWALTYQIVAPSSLEGAAVGKKVGRSSSEVRVGRGCFPFQCDIKPKVLCTLDETN